MSARTNLKPIIRLQRLVHRRVELVPSAPVLWFSSHGESHAPSANGAY
jgi:hypothetical protein